MRTSIPPPPPLLSRRQAADGKGVGDEAAWLQCKAVKRVGSRTFWGWSNHSRVAQPCEEVAIRWGGYGGFLEESKSGKRSMNWGPPRSSRTIHTTGGVRSTDFFRGSSGGTLTRGGGGGEARERGGHGAGYARFFLSFSSEVLLPGDPIGPSLRPGREAAGPGRAVRFHWLLSRRAAAPGKQGLGLSR
eukprot:763078-Hanusia_phi.AAC.2